MLAGLPGTAAGGAPRARGLPAPPLPQEPRAPSRGATAALGPSAAPLLTAEPGRCPERGPAQPPAARAPGIAATPPSREGSARPGASRGRRAPTGPASALPRREAVERPRAVAL
ncbi:collagen alpha-1(I) chain-like [Ammospiza caudacuta]|uniref:collagen alpha-1(I) chain-like n=1 Tax=Ammospiza caudacuta TaxID=2857398 RepID=UPI0027386935|nr:collagen alpha-1(I) chain-like [Ammospiza caudacuta]